MKEHIKEIKFNQDSELIIASIHEYLLENKQLDAILFGTNHIGVYGLKVINKLGLKVPGDLGIIFL